MTQLILFKVENDQGEYETKSLSFTDKPVSPYYPRGNAKGVNQYFRFSYRDGEQMKHLHIPGGNTRSPLAISRAKKILTFIEEGATPSQVKDLIKSWQKKPAKFQSLQGIKTSGNTLF
ncbi:hypothetical protein [Aliterella atlantica]|uniref:Uncharacterized protein n=1 Tax=Aliterella atlantica CENA595 TaxID=1618023 RepID=A0A0D8ZR77_9CYAN|nr:hypothetical protein [Aliterella atlantica]KJH71220.1 hypothetical protein UH38_13060 [Aliterella atlantica CENA595]